VALMSGVVTLRQSTASQEVLLGPFLDDTDGKTAETALSISNTDIKIWKTGGTTEASKNSGGATHIAAGRYYAVLDATDTDTIGPLEINVHVSGALPVKKICEVLDDAVYDVKFGTVAPSTYAGADTAGTGTLLTRLSSTRAGYLDNLSAGAVAQASNLATLAGYVDTEVAAIQADVTTLLTRLSSIRAGYLDNLSAGAVAQASNLATLAGYVDTEVAAIQADVTTLLTRLSSIRAGYLDNLSAGAVAQASNLATLAGYVDTEVAAILAIANKLDTALELDGAVYRFTVNALELAPSGGGGVADWTADERTAIRTILGIPGSGTTPTVPSAGALKVIDDLVDTEVGAIQSDVSTLLTRLSATRAGYLDNLSAGAVAQASNLATLAGYVDTEVAAILAIAQKLDTALELDGAVYRFTVNALELAPSGGGGGGVVSGYAAGQDPWTLIAAGIVEGTTSFVASIRNLNGVASGNTVGNGTGTVQMKSLDGAKNRAVGTIDGSGNRTITSRDLT
jgi:hypothetical protein